jgi:hypothetical protein
MLTEGQTDRLSFPSGWILLSRRSAASFARASANTKVTHSGEDSHLSLCRTEYIQVQTLRWQGQAIKELFAAVHKEAFERRDGELRLYSTG